MERKNCPHCGAQLPNEAAFCPHCAGSIHKRTEVKLPRHMPGWALRSALIAVCILAVALAGWLHTRPKTYDDGGTATVIYTDRDGSYQLLLGWRNDPYTPARRSIMRRSWTGSTAFPCACSSTIQAATPTRPMPL